MSNLRTKFDVDDPLILDAFYKIGTILDRRKIDDQIGDIQRVLVDAVMSQRTDSYFELSNASDPLEPGDIFCLSQAEEDGVLVTKATADKLSVATAAVGMAATAVTPGTKFRGITRGIIPRELCNLGIGSTSIVGVNGTTARIGRVPDPDIGNTLVGFCDIRGTILFTGSAAAIGGGGGGGGITPIGTPADGDIIAWSATLGNWIVTPRSAFSINAFSATTPLVEVGTTVSSPSFTASLSSALALGDTAVLTNNFDSESKNVFATPTAFSSAHNFALTAPNQSVTFTYTIQKIANPVAVRTTSISTGQKNYAAVAAAGAPMATILALSPAYSLLTTSRAGSFSLTDNGLHRMHWFGPSRYGTPIFKDTTTGFGLAITLIETANVTNAHGFIESYSHWQLDNPYNGTLLWSVS